MEIFEASALTDLPRFPAHMATLALVERAAPSGSETFFQKLAKEPFSQSGIVASASAEADMAALALEIVPAALRTDPFLDHWIADMSDISLSICDMLKSDQVRVSLDSHRSCRRYHTDNLSMRTVITYFGQGTEYLPDHAADRDAYVNGAWNDDIVKDPTAIRHIQPWTVGVIRGGPDGLLHKTPDAALGQAGVFMRVDPVLS